MAFTRGTVKLWWRGVLGVGFVSGGKGWRWEWGRDTHYCSDTSEPAKAKSQSCFEQVSGEVRPGFRPQPVRYSTQFGPPSAVLVCGA